MPSTESANDPAVDQDPVLQPGFTIEIANMEDHRLNGNFQIDFDGTLRLPYNVVINCGGLKLSDLKQRLVTSYQKFFQSASTFQVKLVKRMYMVDVRGLVMKPGQISVKPHASLDSIIGLVGGLSKEPSPRYVNILRKDKTQVGLSIADYFKAGSRFSGLEIHAGDTLFFQIDSPTQTGVSMKNLTTVEMMGEVVRPGPLTYYPGIDFYDYLQQAGGPAPMADLSHVKIIRGAPQNRLITDVDLVEEAKRPVIRPGDLILVPYDKPTPTEKTIGLAGSVAAVISAIALVLIAGGYKR